MSNSWGKIVGFIKQHKGKIGLGTLALLLTILSSTTDVLDYFGVTPKRAPEVIAIPTAFFEMISVPTQVKCGEDAEVSMRTKPSTMCYLVYTTPSGNVSEAEGVGVTTANVEGQCSWKWRISSKTKLGVGEISIKVGDIERTYQIEITE